MDTGDIIKFGYKVGRIEETFFSPDSGRVLYRISSPNGVYRHFHDASEWVEEQDNLPFLPATEDDLEAEVERHIGLLEKQIEALRKMYPNGNEIYP